MAYNNAISTTDTEIEFYQIRGVSGANKSRSNEFFVTKVQGCAKSFAHHLFEHGFLRTLLLLQKIWYGRTWIECVLHTPHADPHDT